MTLQGYSPVSPLGKRGVKAESQHYPNQIKTQEVSSEDLDDNMQNMHAAIERPAMATDTFDSIWREMDDSNQDIKNKSLQIPSHYKSLHLTENEQKHWFDNQPTSPDNSTSHPSIPQDRVTTPNEEGTSSRNLRPEFVF
ncbi:hypothetical protein AVEN_268-1 [Araneus ventricosus]|uniref:Uncharacterized protein n=1 Tax=Araneus ventricosus TaxID=182803 RepID=A0A4Y2CMZ6_ARAVE|nr:hypothetical protein AVEN_268-1 [Araneus ventricosus]